jgi:LysM repeat protein
MAAQAAAPAAAPAAGGGDTGEVPGVTTQSGATPAAPAAAATPAADPKKIARFKELLAKAGGAAAPAAGGAAKAKPAATPASAGGTYKIKSGDNLTNIAKANGTTVQAIMQANPQIKDANKISAGASLNLPGAAQSGAKASGSPAANPIKNTDTNTQGVGGLDVSGSMVGA